MRIEVTEAAAETVRAVRARGRTNLVMVLSNGCCDSTAPFLYDNYVIGPDAESVGEIEGVEVFAPAWIRTLYPDDSLTVDVIEGANEDSFSLETDLGRRFVLRAPGNAGLG
jgi:uncharacterized protein (DUF779 family)